MPLPRLLLALLLLAALLITPAYAEDAQVFSDVPESASETVIPAEPPAFVAQVLAVAIGELGYVEGPDNQSKYGLWAGDEHAAWCAEFVCWCVAQADERNGTALLNATYPFYTSQNTGRDWFVARGRFVNRKGNLADWGYQWLLGSDTLLRKNGYIPRPGDWMFFAYDEAGNTAHVALVEYSARDAQGNVVVHVIEGNNPDRVQRNRYYLDSSQVLGFGCCEDVIGTTMRFGNTGDKVLALQSDLNYLGFLGARHLTGTYGSNTRAAVNSFQRYMGLTENGLADIVTQNALAAEVARKRFDAPEGWIVTEE